MKTRRKRYSIPFTGSYRYPIDGGRLDDSSVVQVSRDYESTETAAIFARKVESTFAKYLTLSKSTV